MIWFKTVYMYMDNVDCRLTWPREWLPPLLLIVTLYTSVTEVLDSMPTMVCPASWMAVHQFTRSSGVRVFFSDPVENEMINCTWHTKIGLLKIYCAQGNSHPILFSSLLPSVSMGKFQCFKLYLLKHVNSYCANLRQDKPFTERWK